MTSFRSAEGDEIFSATTGSGKLGAGFVDSSKDCGFFRIPAPLRTTSYFPRRGFPHLIVSMTGADDGVGDFME
jgi:hypothetical protein